MITGNLLISAGPRSGLVLAFYSTQRCLLETAMQSQSRLYTCIFILWERWYECWKCFFTVYLHSKLHGQSSRPILRNLWASYNKCFTINKLFCKIVLLCLVGPAKSQVCPKDNYSLRSTISDVDLFRFRCIYILKHI
jgi:hypothetical protein